MRSSSRASASAQLLAWIVVAEPSWRLTWKPDDALSITTGIEGSVHKVSQGASMAVTDNNPLSAITSQLGTFTTGGAMLEALVRPTRDWLIRPGVRADVFVPSAFVRRRVSRA